MAETNSRFFTLMVVGDDPLKIVEKYGANFKSEPYVKYRYLDAKKYKNNAIKVLSKLLESEDKIGINAQIKSSLKHRLEILKRMSPFDYYRELTDGMFYDDDGNALSEENPDCKYNTCRVGRNFSLPLKLKDGSESYSALSKDIDWEVMNGANKHVYERAWEIVVDGDKPKTEEEETIANSMGDKKSYFSNFSSKEKYVNYCTAYWNYAYVDENGWVDVDDNGNEEEWISEFYSRFVENLKPNDLVSIFECSVNNG